MESLLEYMQISSKWPLLSGLHTLGIINSDACAYMCSFTLVYSCALCISVRNVVLAWLYSLWHTFPVFNNFAGSSLFLLIQLQVLILGSRWNFKSRRTHGNKYIELGDIKVARSLSISRSARPDTQGLGTGGALVNGDPKEGSLAGSLSWDSPVALCMACTSSCSAQPYACFGVGGGPCNGNLHFHFNLSFLS